MIANRPIAVLVGCITSDVFLAVVAEEREISFDRFAVLILSDLFQFAVLWGFWAVEQLVSFEWNTLNLIARQDPNLNFSDLQVVEFAIVFHVRLVRDKINLIFGTRHGHK